jgi:hypothetical protein
MPRLALVLLMAAAAAGADSTLLRLVMPEARIVSGISIARMKKTPFGQFLLAEFSASQDQGFDSFVNASGFDPRYHLTEILFASPGRADSSTRLVLVRGSFAPPRIAELARQAGAAIAPHQGIDVITNPKAASASPPTAPKAIAFLDPEIAVYGDAASVRAAIERRNRGAGPSLVIARKVRALSPVMDAWFVSTVPLAELIQRLPRRTPSSTLKAEALPSIRLASGGVIFGASVKFSAEFVARNPQDAASLAILLRLLVTQLLASGPQQGAQPALPVEALQLSAHGNLVRLAFAVPESQLESLIQSAGR